MIAAGVPVTSVQKLLGHTSIRTTQLYVQVADGQVERDYHAGIQKVIEICSLPLEVSMDEAPATTSPNILFESPEDSPTLWSISDGALSDRNSSLDILPYQNVWNELPEWLRTPLRRFLRLKQRNWPAKTVQRSTRQLFSRLNHVITFFIQHYEWSEWQQLAPNWLEDYIDARLREGIAPGTINWI